ncbi:MAG: flavodoxin domain-containing protein [Bacteroidota bacterium]
MKKTALIFSPLGGSVNNVAIKLGEVIGNDKVDIFHVSKFTKGDLAGYEQLILIGSTVGADHWTNDVPVYEWQEFFRETADIDLEDKKVAIVGLGNSVLYPEHFADGMAFLYRKMKEKKAALFGFVSAEGYTFTDSEALNDEGTFCGLPIDEDNEDELTTERLKKWIAALKHDFMF